MGIWDISLRTDLRNPTFLQSRPLENVPRHPEQITVLRQLQSASVRVSKEPDLQLVEKGPLTETRQ